VTLAISILGLVIAMATFVWQWRTWLYEGAKIKVSCVVGWPTANPEGPPHYLVNVVNVGRSPIELVGWGFRLSTGETTYVPQDPYRPYRLPYSLPGGHGATFFIEVKDLSAALTRTSGATTRVKPFVSTSTKGTIYGKSFDVPRP
jgi:hypothetical protein